jgi:hypothetical protein
MSVIDVNGRDTNEQGDAQKVANILLEAATDKRYLAKDWRTRSGWSDKFRNRLVREAGCGYNAALFLIDDLKFELRRASKA